MHEDNLLNMALPYHGCSNFNSIIGSRCRTYRKYHFGNLLDFCDSLHSNSTKSQI